MEDKQLNFNQPLLSVRRFSSTLTSQKDEKKKADTKISSIPSLLYRSELKSGPITNAGSVPFVWEHSPGRPKDERSPQIHATERPPTVPKLPPGKTLKAKEQDSDRVFKGTVVTNGPGPGESPCGSQLIVPSLEEKVSEFDSSKENLKEHSSDSDDADEAYMDALDTLSRGESSFYNCSVGGLSGLESDVKPSETFSIDPKTRDFMMGRFLPAAKAMASEAPQHAPRKQPMVWEQPRQVKKIVNADRRPALRFGPNYTQDYANNRAEEESDDDCDKNENMSFKVCGLLPRFALKSSFCLLNPLPGMSVRTSVPVSSVRRSHASSFSAAGSCNESENEPARVALYEQRSSHGFQAERPNDETVLKNESSRISRHYDSQKLEGSTLYKCLQGNSDLSTYNEVSESVVYGKEGCIPAEVHGAGIYGFSQNKKDPNSCTELLSDQTPSMEIELGSLIEEKTLYVDIIHKMESQKRNSRSVDMKGQANAREADTVIHAMSNKLQLKDTTYVQSPIKDIGSLSIPCGEPTLESNVRDHVDKGMLADESNEDVVTEIKKDFGQGVKSNHDSKIFRNTKVSDNGHMDFNLLAENSKKSHRSSSELPAPPPLPKSPSDSWLWRTLPSIPSKNAVSRSYIGKGVKPSSRTSSTHPKWEKIVKTTEPQHQYLRVPEGALMPIPET